MATAFSPIAGAATADKPATPKTVFSVAEPAGRAALITLVSMAALLVFAYWDVLGEVAFEWSQPQYSHGWIIPLIALFIMWTRRPNPIGEAPADQAIIGKVKSAGIAFGGLAALGKLRRFRDYSIVSGIGLAGLCLAGLFACLIGQPYAAPSLKSTARQGESLLADWDDLCGNSDRVGRDVDSICSVSLAAASSGLLPDFRVGHSVHRRPGLRNDLPTQTRHTGPLSLPSQPSLLGFDRLLDVFDGRGHAALALLVTAIVTDFGSDP